MANYGNTILLVEDNDDDVELTLRAFRDAGLSNPIVRARTGEEGLAYLQRTGKFAEAQHDLPVVVLLDIKLPGKSGLQVLQIIREDARLQTLPVVMLTSSSEDVDRNTAYKHHANSYVVKPVDYKQFVTAARALGLYWSVTNVPPAG